MLNFLTGRQLSVGSTASSIIIIIIISNCRGEVICLQASPPAGLECSPQRPQSSSLIAFTSSLCENPALLKAQRKLFQFWWQRWWVKRAPNTQLPPAVSAGGAFIWSWQRQQQMLHHIFTGKTNQFKPHSHHIEICIYEIQRITNKSNAFVSVTVWGLENVL